MPDHNHRQEGLGDAADWQDVRWGASSLKVSDLEAALTVKCGKDTALASKLAELTMAMSCLDQFLAELRAIFAEGEACDGGVDV